jgi:predicted TPR repeat methyltransferase
MNRSSGDSIVDRRYAYAAAAAAEGDWRAAADVLEQAMERAPHWASGWLALGEARENLAEKEAAAAAYRKALALDPADALGAAPRLARLDALTLATLPPAYVRALFDGYAPRFEKHLTQDLAYRGPALMLAALDNVAPGQRFACALDLGCGAGLMGASLRARVDALIGVDLAPAMVAKTRERNIYDELAVGELGAFLAERRAGDADLIVAADVLPYLGDLAPLFHTAARALSAGGLFAFTAEACEGESYRLGAGLRFAHSRDYLEQCAIVAGLNVRLLESGAARRENGRDAPGWIGVIERSAADASRTLCADRTEDRPCELPAPQANSFGRA